MISAEQNERMTQVGAGTPGGRLMRQYWQPIALEVELEQDRPVRAVKVMGQDLVVFRDEQGRYGLLDRDCPHRGADLAFGRLEHGGLRCAFHGWLFSVDGRCLETPGEPQGSRLCHGVRQRAYPVDVRSGVIFGYLGEGDPPALPALDCLIAPDPYTFGFKGFLDCNWLQALEVGIDPAHASFLHRFFEDEDTDGAYGKQFRSASANSSIPMTKVLRERVNPDIHVESAPYGMQLTSLRTLDAETTHVRVTNLLFPNAFAIPLSAEISITQWHVPIDDVSCYWFAIFTSFTAPLDKAQMRDQRLQLYTLPDYLPRVGRANNYGFDAAQQKTETYTGMGFDINVHDAWAVESQGRIQDRTREHLGKTDTAIVFYRKMLVEALAQVEAGHRPLMVLDADGARAIRGPRSIDVVAPASGWSTHWRDADAHLHRNAAWKDEAVLALGQG